MTYWTPEYIFISFKVPIIYSFQKLLLARFQSKLMNHRKYRRKSILDSFDSNSGIGNLDVGSVQIDASDTKIQLWGVFQNIITGSLTPLHLTVSVQFFAINQSLNTLHVFFGGIYFCKGILKLPMQGVSVMIMQPWC